MKAYDLNNFVRSLQVNRQSTEATLHLIDGSTLHFRSDPHSHWFQAQGRLAHDLGPTLLRFGLGGRWLELEFTDGSQLRTGWRGQALEIEVSQNPGSKVG